MYKSSGDVEWSQLPTEFATESAEATAKGEKTPTVGFSIFPAEAQRRGRII